LLRTVRIVVSTPHVVVVVVAVVAVVAAAVAAVLGDVVQKFMNIAW